MNKNGSNSEEKKFEDLVYKILTISQLENDMTNILSKSTEEVKLFLEEYHTSKTSGGEGY